MSQTDKSIWTRRYYLPGFPRFGRSLFSPPMLRRYLFCLACLATVIALFYAEEDWRGKHGWESNMRQSRANGTELDWHSYVPPPVPDDQNFGLTPLFAGLFDYEYTKTNTHWRDTNIWSRIDKVSISVAPPAQKLSDWVHGRSLDLKAWQAYFRIANFPQTNYWPIPVQPQESAADVLLALSKLDPELAELRLAATLPQSRFPIHYDEMAKAMLPHIGLLANLAWVLELRAVAELKLGRSQQAFADAILVLFCADAIRSEPFMVSQIMRSHMMEGGLQPIWEGLAAHRWSEEQLKEFQLYFSKTDLLSVYGQSVKAELAWDCGCIESVPDDPTSFSLFNPSGFIPEVLPDSFLRTLPLGWFYQNELCAARFFHESILTDVLPQAQRVYPGLSRTNSELFDKLPNTLYSFVFKHLGGVVSPQEFVRVQTEINLALVACALERFRMAAGHFPETLDSLAPALLEKLPHDIINGELLKYRLTGDGSFILYSVGWNEKDDGGSFPTPENQKLGPKARDWTKYHPETGDWVWQYPENR